MPDTQVNAREIRVFLSSTFKDMELERTHLMSHVFPLVRQRCHERDVVFTEIDLRWGVTEEAAQNGRTVQICLEEIERCRSLGLPPFFIGFIGERYGWVPTPQELGRYWDEHSASPYAEPIRQALAQGLSVTELEIRYGFLDPLAVNLTGRVLMLMRDQALTNRLAQPALTQDPVATATRPSSLGAQLRRLFTAELAPTAPNMPSMPLDGTYYDPACNQQIARLKDAVREAHRAGTTALVDGYRSVEDFGRAVHDYLMEQLDVLFPPQQTPDAQAQALAAHQAYAASRLRSYVTNPPLVDHVLAWLSAPAKPQLGMLHGASGSGKSAFLANISAQLAARGDRWVFTHFCGVDGYTSLDHWRDRLLSALQAQGWVTAELPGQDAARWGALPLWLEQARRATDQPIVLVIDAVNQLANASSALHQLQSVSWPEGVRVLASCTLELEVAPVWHIEPMPALDEAARRRFITSYLGNFAKSVSTLMMQKLVTAPSCDNPLFLKLVLEELRLRATHESLSTCMDELLRRAEPGALFLACLDGLDRDFASYTPQMGTRAARLLAASRRGLTHHELAELLTPPGQARVPDAVLLPLLASLQPYCEMHEGRRQLMHGILADALQARHPDVLVVRRQLMTYFSGGEPWEITEYAYQLLRTEFTNSEELLQDMFIGQYDEQEVQNTFKGNHLAYMLHKGFQMNARIVENFSDLRVFLKVWEIDSAVTYNGLNSIGAGKPWQLSDFQDSLVDAWFSSIEPLRAGEVQVLRPEQLGAWLVESRFFFLAKTFLRRLIALQKLRLPDAGAACAIAAMNLADAHFKESEFKDAEALLWQALEHWQRAGLARSRPAIPTLCLLAATLMQLGDAARALPLQEQAIAIHMEGRTEADREACTMATPVALMNAALGYFDEARECALSTLEARRRLLGPMHPDVAETLVVLWEICVRERDTVGAERHLREAVQLLRATVSVGDPFLADFLSKLAMQVAARGESAEAEELYDEARLSYQAKDPPFNPNVLSVLFQLSELQYARGDADSSQSSLEELIWLYDKLERVPPAQLFDAARAQVRLGALLSERGEVVKAAEHYSEAYALLKRIPEQEETQSLMTLAREGMGTPVPGPSFAVAGYGQVVQHPVVRYQLNIAKF